MPGNNNPPGQNSPPKPALTGQAVAMGIGIFLVASAIAIAICSIIGALVFWFTCWLFTKMFGRHSIPMPNFSISVGISFTMSLLSFGANLVVGLLVYCTSCDLTQELIIRLIAMVVCLVGCVKIVSSALPTSAGKAIALLVMQTIVWVIIILFIVFLFAGAIGAARLGTMH